MAGKSLALFNERRSDCAEAWSRADTKAYLRGRDLGLKTYCQVQNAAQVGLRGEPTKASAPPQLIVNSAAAIKSVSTFIAFMTKLRSSKIATIPLSIASIITRWNSNAVWPTREKTADIRLYREFDYEQRRIRGEQGAIQTKLQWTHDQLRNAEGALAQLR